MANNLSLKQLKIAKQAAKNLRIPPHSVRAEQSIIGGLMLDNNTWDEVINCIKSNDFYRREHRLIFDAIFKLSENNKPFDVVTVAEELERSNLLQEVGDLVYLGNLANDTPSAANISSYVDIVREHSIIRQLIAVGTEIANSGFKTEGRKSNELLNEAEHKVFKIAEQSQRGEGSRNHSGFKPSKELINRALQRIEQLYSSDKPITGISTGFTDLDEKTSGLQESDLIIIAGRPSMGKTALAMNIAEHVIIKDNKSVAVFSLEMPGEQLSMRMMASLGRVDQHRVRTGKLLDDEWPRLASAVNLLADAPLYIDDTALLTPTEMRARLRRLKRECNSELGLIIIDYLQLIEVPGSENRTNEISTISRALKALAKELNVPVIALSQLNRGLEQRTNKRPIMSDLRESGSIEQDADLVIFIYRDEVYNDNLPEEEKGRAEIIISKQRNGPTGTINLTFLNKYTKFENFAPINYGKF